MTNINIPAWQSRRLLQMGMSLILFSAFWGFAIPHVSSPRIGLSVHTLSALEAVLLLLQGLLWRDLALGPRALRIAFWCAIYSTFAILAAYLVASLLGFGLATIALMGELPHGLVRGTPAQEALVRALAYSSAPTGITGYALVLWGLRGARS